MEWSLLSVVAAVQARTDHLNATRAAMERDEARVQAAEQNRRLMKEALVQYFEDCESVQRSNALKVAQHAASFACQVSAFWVHQPTNSTAGILP